MRMIRADPQPVGGESDDRWCYPSGKPNVVSGGLYFTYPCISALDERCTVPLRGGIFDCIAPETGMELVRVGCTWYWTDGVQS